MALIQVAKKILRKEIENKISLLSTEEKNKQSETVIKKLISSAEFKRSKRISIYLSTDGEISTEPILREIFQQKKTCFVPRYNKSVMEMVKLNSMEDWDTLPLTKWKIKQPHVSEIRENALESGGLDLIIVPGVAFTPSGSRLGHGKGFYDIFLSSLEEHQSTPVITIALAFKQQVLKDIPVHAHDVPIDYVLYSH